MLCCTVSISEYFNTSYIPGSSHCRDLSREIHGASITAISGGGVGHCMSVVKDKKTKGGLNNIRMVLIICGGNDICQRSKDGKTEVCMTSDEVLLWMANFVR